LIGSLELPLVVVVKNNFFALPTRDSLDNINIIGENNYGKCT